MVCWPVTLDKSRSGAGAIFILLLFKKGYFIAKISANLDLCVIVVLTVRQTLALLYISVKFLHQIQLCSSIQAKLGGGNPQKF